MLKSLSGYEKAGKPAGQRDPRPWPVPMQPQPTIGCPQSQLQEMRLRLIPNVRSCRREKAMALGRFLVEGSTFLKWAPRARATGQLS